MIEYKLFAQRVVLDSLESRIQ